MPQGHRQFSHYQARAHSSNPPQSPQTEPQSSYPGKYMGIRCSDNVIVFNVPSQGTEDYQVHLRYRLIDVITGYRNNWLGIQSNTNVIL